MRPNQSYLFFQSSPIGLLERLLSQSSRFPSGKSRLSYPVLCFFETTTELAYPVGGSCWFVGFEQVCYLTIIFFHQNVFWLDAVFDPNLKIQVFDATQFFFLVGCEYLLSVKIFFNAPAAPVAPVAVRDLP